MVPLPPVPPKTTAAESLSRVVLLKISWSELSNRLLAINKPNHVLTLLPTPLPTPQPVQLPQKLRNRRSVEGAGTGRSDKLSDQLQLTLDKVPPSLWDFSLACPTPPYIDGCKIPSFGRTLLPTQPSGLRKRFVRSSSLENIAQAAQTQILH